MVDDVVMKPVDDDDEDDPSMVAEPPRGPSSAEVLFRLEAEARKHFEKDEAEYAPPAEGRFRFSLLQLFASITGIAVLLGLMRLVWPAPAAGLAGLAVLAVTMWVVLHGSVPAVVWIVWGLFFLTYLVASFVALMMAA